MDWKLELVFVPVSDVDRAKAFYVNQVGFNADYDQQVNDKLRFVQLTPPGSACSIAIGTGLIDMVPGTLRNLQVVVPTSRRPVPSSWSAAWMPATWTSGPGDSSSPSPTRMAIPGPCRSFRRVRARPGYPARVQVNRDAGEAGRVVGARAGVEAWKSRWCTARWGTPPRRWRARRGPLMGAPG